MVILLVLGFFIVFFAAILIIVSKWNEAKIKRDVAWITRTGAGIVVGEKKPSPILYLFK